ncbi:MAG: DUF2510 domain-containing protein [Acidimicrobiales bacterium]
MPTRTESIRRHVGMIVMQRFVKLSQPLCRDHGIEITRTYLRKTLIEGWWGFISFFLNFFTVGNDLVVLSRYRGLGEPQPLAGGARPAPAEPPAPPTAAPAPAQFAPTPAPAPAPAPSPAPAVAAGWYPDPSGRFEHRWHDGQTWTSTVATQGQQYHDPVPG